MVMVSENGKQLVGKKFEEYLTSIGDQHRKTSIAHPQSNGQVEVTNRTLRVRIKRIIDDAKGKWAEDLYHMLWTYRTTQRMTTGDSHFGWHIEHMHWFQVDISSPSLRVKTSNRCIMKKKTLENQDLVDEVREVAVQCLSIIS